MNLIEISRINKDYFGYEVLAKVLGITQDSARVTASRYVQKKVLLRAKRNLYVIKDKLQHFDRQQKYALANLIQVPSYISLMTALDYYEITTQMQRDFIESIVLKRTKEVKLENIIFNYTRIDPGFYYGFKKDSGFFIATPEKALVDAVYFMSLGRYTFDWSSIDKNKLDLNLIKKEIKKFPLRSKRLLESHGYLSKT
jgi:predicted transcriptional regulator of viral defense system